MQGFKFDKKIVLITIVVSFALLQIKIHMNGQQAIDVGIIGGAAGPTATFIATKIGPESMTFLAAVLALIIVLLTTMITNKVRKRREK